MKVKIGLEIHVQLLTKSKLFCSCSTNYENKEPNENTCPICLGFPGSKPKVNKKALDFGIMVALALNCKIAEKTFFSRKSYFYPDMSKNYQITQYEIPLAKNGFLEIGKKKIRIRRVHLEEDPAKLIHVGKDITSAQHVLIDYNRSGIPLVEIVTEPDFENPREVREFLEKLSSILEHLEVYDSSKEGSMRIDVNISLEGGERVEIKNISGFKRIEKALMYEIVRQENLRRLGLKVKRETRHFDERSGLTFSLRKKEVEEDYGYIFDTDLPVVEISKGWVNSLAKSMPELPHKRVERFVEEFNLPKERAKVLVYTDKQLADFFEKCAEVYKNYERLSKWIVTDLLKCLNWHGIRINQSKVKVESFAELLKLIDEGEITERLAKEIIKEYVNTGKSPSKIIEEKGLRLIRDEKEIEKVIKIVLAENRKAVKDYRKGERKALNFLIGKVLQKTNKRIDPKVIRKIIKKALNEDCTKKPR